MAAPVTAPPEDEVRPYRFNVDQYHRMFESGILHYKVELLDGIVWDACEGHEPAPMRFTVDQYERMAEAGIFDPEARTELIEGEVYLLPPAGDWHNAGVDSLASELRPPRRGDWILRSQGSLRVLAGSDPEPDITLLRPRADFYREGGARPADVLLIVEVSDTTIRHDRERKLAMYAEAGIPEVWIVTHEPRAIEVYREPAGSAYAVRQVFGRDDVVSTPAAPGVEIRVSDITG
jgi:Uma2 family endonuclease